MKSVIIAMVLILLIGIPVMADIEFDWSWNSADYILQGFSTGLLIIDWGQTRCISLYGKELNVIETNPELGRYPSLPMVDDYFKRMITHDIVLSLIAPKIKIVFDNGIVVKINFRTANQFGTYIVESPAIIKNYQLGLYPCF